MEFFPVLWIVCRENSRVGSRPISCEHTSLRFWRKYYRSFCLHERGKNNNKWYSHILSDTTQSKKENQKSPLINTLFLKTQQIIKNIMIKNYRDKDIIRYWMTRKKHLSKKRYSIVSSSYRKMFLHLSVCFSKKFWIQRRFPYVLHAVLLFSNLWNRSSDKIK